MALFTRKSEPPASTAVVTYQPPIQPSAAPRATTLETEIRREIFHHLSPALANAAGLASVAELLEWVSGARRLDSQALNAVGRMMGLLVEPPTGLDRIRSMVAARLKRTALANLLFDKSVQSALRLDFNDLQNFAEGFDNLSSVQLDGLARLLFDASYDPATKTLRHLKPVETTALCTAYPPPAKGAPLAELIGANMEREGLSWRPKGPAFHTIYDAAPPTKAPEWPALPGWT
jgi:hypothetical protein